MDSYKIVRNTGRYIVLTIHADGMRRWSPWFANKLQAETRIVQQTKFLPNGIDC
jgi:hypothetical protein